MLAATAWEKEANARLAKHPDYAKALADIEKARDGVIEAARKLERAQHGMMTKLSKVELPPTPGVIEPKIDATAPAPLFTSVDDFVTATRRLMASKALDDEDGGEQ
jgi:hypothetical protein